MSTNHTEHYNLSQWEKSDKVQMEDFNADNAKIDAALKALEQRMDGSAEGSDVAELNQQLGHIQAQLKQLGTAGIFTHMYYGSGSITQHVSLIHRPMVVFLWALDDSLPLVTAFYGHERTTSPDVTFHDWPKTGGLTGFTGIKYNEKGKLYLATAITDNIS